MRAKTKFVKTGDSLLEKKSLTFHYISNVFLVAIAFKGILRCVQAAKQQAVRLSSDCINGKYLWALPTPTTFKKVDQTFIIAWLNCELNHNLPQLKNLNFKIRQIPLQSLFVAVSVITKIIYSVKAYTVIFPVIGICIAVPRGGNSGKVRIFAVR